VRSGRFDGTRVLLFGIAVFAVLAAVGGTYFGLRGGQGKGSSHLVSDPASTTTLAPPATKTSPTTAAAGPSAATRPLSNTSKPVAVAGGTFVVIGGNVSLTHVVAPGDTLFAISQWYKLMGGYAMLYKWNHSVIGNNPDLILPGEVLTITVPGAEIPKISPVFLAEAKAEAKAKAKPRT
jgi:nucleoid-associated protein YgaU